MVLLSLLVIKTILVESLLWWITIVDLVKEMWILIKCTSKCNNAGIH